MFVWADIVPFVFKELNVNVFLLYTDCCMYPFLSVYQFHTSPCTGHACLNVLLWKCVYAFVCVCVCMHPAGYHADNIPLNYYNGLLMGLSKWLRAGRDQEQARV